MTAGAWPRRPAIPLADGAALGSLARRATARRLAVALAVLALAGAAAAAARGLDTRPTSYFAGGGGGAVVAVDLSTSVDPTRYRRVANVLNGLADSGQPLGLVVFSDRAYEMLPPGTRGDEIRPLVRFFTPTRRLRRDAPLAERARSRFRESPWSGTFRGGTRISSGLRVARQVLARDGVEGGSVLLVSDLDDAPSDVAALTRELIRYEREGVRLRVVPLFPAPPDEAIFSRVLGPGALVARPELRRNVAVEERQTLHASFPLRLVVIAAALLLLLAVNERISARLAWGRAT